MPAKVGPADGIVLSPVVAPTPAPAPAEEPAALTASQPDLTQSTTNVPSVVDMLSSLKTNVACLPENIRRTLQEERSFKELTPIGVDFVKTLETDPKRKIQQEERMIEFRHVVAQIFKTYDLFSDDVIHAKIRSISDILCYHAKKIFRAHCKNRQQMQETRHKIVFTCLSYYLTKRGVISDNLQQYQILNTIIEASILHTPRRIKVQSRKKYSFYA